VGSILHPCRSLCVLPFVLSAYHPYLRTLIHLRGTIAIHSGPGELPHSLRHHILNPLNADQVLQTVTMPHDHVPTASGSSSNFRSIFDAALKDYKAKTRKDLLAHQLTAELQTCDSPSAILDVLNKQYNIQQFIQLQSDGQRSKQWFNATVTVLCAFSAALGEGVGIVKSTQVFL
jgi:hypothetical protein